MSSNVYLRVFGLKGITPRMVNNHPKGKVWCSADLGDTKLETVKNGIGGGSLAVNEVRVCLCGSRRVSFVFVLPCSVLLVAFGGARVAAGLGTCVLCLA